MARSSYIYVVMSGAGSLPLATFTVKHEMATWLKNREPESVRVYRYPDGGSGRQVSAMDVAELFA